MMRSNAAPQCLPAEVAKRRHSSGDVTDDFGDLIVQSSRQGEWVVADGKHLPWRNGRRGCHVRGKENHGPDVSVVDVRLV